MWRPGIVAVGLALVVDIIVGGIVGSLFRRLGELGRTRLAVTLALGGAATIAALVLRTLVTGLASSGFYSGAKTRITGGNSPAQAARPSRS